MPAPKKRWTGSLYLALLAGASGVWAQGGTEPQTCEGCDFDWGTRGYLELGLLAADNEDVGYTGYKGLDDNGFYANGGAVVRSRSETGDYWSLKAEDLGVESRRAGLEAGHQGSYRYFLDYRELTSGYDSSAATPFSGVGSANLTLPNNWVRSSSTGGMTELDGALRNITLELKRKTLATGFQFLQGEHWDYNFQYTGDERDGTRQKGGSFIFNSALLAEPVEDITHRFDLSVGYLEDLWQVRLAYHGSFYRNDREPLVWDNPFSDFNGEDRGRLAAAPDNQFHRLTLSGAYRPWSWLQSSGQLAIGRMSQDETFIPATINGNLAAVTLPRDNLDAEVDTLNARLRLVGVVGRRLTLNAEGFYDERDNKTPVEAYQQVSTDVFLAGLQENRPYSFEKSGGEFSADYRLMRRTTLTGGYGRERKEQTLQEVDATNTDSVFAQLRTRAWEHADLRLRLEHEDRDIDGEYEPLGLVPGENPLLRKYNLADRERDKAGLRVNLYPTDAVSVGMQAEYARDDYHNSGIGLTESKDRLYSADVTWSPTHNLNSYVYLTRQVISSDIAGSNNFAGPDWFADYKDTVRTFGGGVQANGVVPDLDMGLDLNFTRSEGDIGIRTSTSDQAFPDLTADRISLQLYGEYAYSERWSFRLDYLVESYDQDDFAIDGVAPDTINSVLTLGRESPDYLVHVVGISTRYHF